MRNHIRPAFLSRWNPVYPSCAVCRLLLRHQVLLLESTDRLLPLVLCSDIRSSFLLRLQSIRRLHPCLRSQDSVTMLSVLRGFQGLLILLHLLLLFCSLHPLLFQKVVLQHQAFFDCTHCGFKIFIVFQALSCIKIIIV